MVEVIRRKKENSEVYRIPEGKAQISYNSDGHLVVRALTLAGDNEDALVVFDQEASDAIIRFVQGQLVSRRGMEIPF